jgi:hypothetical protein
MKKSFPLLLCLFSSTRSFSVVRNPAQLRVLQYRGVSSTSSPTFLSAKPKRGSIVETYQTVSVNCAKCKERLFRYKKKNGTKSNLVKCYVERISEDCVDILAQAPENPPDDYPWQCPSCQTQFARTAMMHGRPALKMVGGKVRMTKK